MLKKALTSIINLLLYGHFWIAAGALLMTMQTSLLLQKGWSWTALDGFIASGTLSIYALHRLVALGLMQGDKQARFLMIFHHRKSILLYAVISTAAAAYFFFQLSFLLQCTLLTPSVIALGYVIPMRNGKRLRDLPFLKIFLIAIAWAWITVIAPSKYLEVNNLQLALIFIERACFVFAITIPFDIRDLLMDEKAAVPTLPGTWGVGKAKSMAYMALLVMMISVFVNVYLDLYTIEIAIALLISALSSASFVYLAHENRHDYFYSGLMDGTMIVQFFLVWMVG